MFKTIVSIEMYDSFLTKVLYNSLVKIKDLTDYENDEKYVFDEQDLCALIVEDGFIKIRTIKSSYIDSDLVADVYDNRGFIQKCIELYPKKLRVTRENLAKRIKKWHKNPDEHLYKSVSELFDEFDWEDLG